MSKKIIIVCMCFIVTFVSCNNDTSTENQNPPELNLSATAELFLDQVLDIMEENSIKKHEIDWLHFRNVVLNEVNGAQTIEDAYPGVVKALVLLNDNHSFLIKPDGEYVFGIRSICTVEEISAPKLPEHIGYVKVNSFSGSSTGDAAISFAEEIQNQIRNNDHSGITGWIVDLRGNGGGNMWPMLAGVGPILGEGVAGFFINADGNEISWGFSNGTSLIGEYPATKLSDSYTLINPNPKVAVLLDNAVASSGEVIAISFIGRENTKSFGTQTCGLTSGNIGYKLLDESTLFLASTFLADRNKKTHSQSIIPNIASNKQDIIEKAVEWITIN